MNAIEATEKIISLVMSDSFTVHIDKHGTIYFSRSDVKNHLNPLQVIVTNLEGDVTVTQSDITLARELGMNVDESGDLLAATRPVFQGKGSKIATKRNDIRQKFFALIQYSQHKQVA